MRTLLVALLVVPTLALGAEKTAEPPADPMAGWVPPKVKSEAKDKQEIQSLFRSMDTAARTGDLDAAVALIDFPVMMMTDDSKGEAMGDAWSREQWIETMKPFYSKPMKDAKVTHKPNVFLLSDSLASVDDVCTMTQGGKTMTTRNSMLLIRKEGKWRVKSMAEGGWGDMMSQSQQGTASGPKGPASEGTGSSAGQQSPTGGTGSGAQSPQDLKPHETSPQERTTK